jgi:hypothetical protein
MNYILPIFLNFIDITFCGLSVKLPSFPQLHRYLQATGLAIRMLHPDAQVHVQIGSWTQRILRSVPVYLAMFVHDPAWRRMQRGVSIPSKSIGKRPLMDEYQELWTTLACCTQRLPVGFIFWSFSVANISRSNGWTEGHIFITVRWLYSDEDTKRVSRNFELFRSM